MTLFESFGDYFLGRFTYQKGNLRTIGVEKEVLAVDSEGKMADLSVTVWPAIEESGKYQMKYDDGYPRVLTGFLMGEDIITTDAGKGTFEFILAPRKTVQEVEETLYAIYRAVSPYLRNFGFTMLGVGHQPLQEKGLKYWNKKRRYEVIIKYYGKDVDWACLSAADQVHIDLAKDEILPAFLIFNKITGFLVALFGNSPIAFGRVSGKKAYREPLWDVMGKERTGIPPREFSSVEDYLAFAFDLKCIVAKVGDTYVYPEKPFREFVKGMSLEETVKHFSLLEGTIWFSSRLRLFGTLEIRPACVQPFDKHVAVPAFCLGLMEMLPELTKWASKFSWEEGIRFRHEAIKNGFESRIQGKPVLPYLHELLEMSREGLRKRGKGEEIYLESLQKMLDSGKNAAEEVIDIWNKGGIKLLLERRGFSY